MRIQFAGDITFGASSGPSTFATCLAQQFFNTGHEVVTDSKNADASLVFIENASAQTLAEPIVLRLDGIWSDRESFEGGRNALIRKTYDSCDAVVFQSEFDKRVITNLFGEPKHSTVIHNGTDAPPIVTSKYPGLEALRQQYDLVFSCSASWHRQKRLKENIELFQHLKSLHPTVKQCLIVLGNPDYTVADPNIFYAGKQPLDVCLETYSMSDWFIHLSAWDHCPNVVTHALSQETPVICTDVGGTKELVGAYGVWLREEREEPMGCFDYDDPPFLNVKQLQILPDKNTLGYHTDVRIETVAKQYVELFKELRRNH